jgi:hypothetical protein
MKGLRTLKTKIMVYKGDEDKYKVDIIINDRYLLTTGGFLDREAIINYIRTALQYAQSYLDFLAEASSVDAKMYNLEELRKHLELALANVLAYEAAED